MGAQHIYKSTHTHEPTPTHTYRKANNKRKQEKKHNHSLAKEPFIAEIESENQKMNKV